MVTCLHMQLDTYLSKHGLTSERFGKVAGIPSKQTIHNYRRGTRFPSPQNLRRIRDATKGAVTADDFVDQHTDHAPPIAPGERDAIIGEAIAVTKGVAALARALRINVTSVYAWRRVPRGRVLAIENATGIPRNRLRPDLYPPEVAGATVSGSPVT